MDYPTLKVKPRSTSLFFVKNLVFIFCVYRCGVWESEATNVPVDSNAHEDTNAHVDTNTQVDTYAKVDTNAQVDTNANVDNNSTVHTTLPETSTTYKMTGSVANTGNTSCMDTMDNGEKRRDGLGKNRMEDHIQTRLDLVECNNLCLKEPTCQAVSYFSPLGACVPYNSSESKADKFAGFHISIRFSKKVCSTTGCRPTMDNGEKRRNGLFQNRMDAHQPIDLEGCKDKCMEKPECLATSYILGMCALFNSSESKADNSTIIFMHFDFFKKVCSLTAVEETTTLTPTARPKAEEIHEGENITAYCIRRMNCSQVCVRVSKTIHHKSQQDSNTTTVDLDNADYKPGCLNDSTNMTCSHAHFLCVLDNCTCGVNNTSDVSVCAQPVVVEPHIEMTSLRAIFVQRQRATYIIMESQGPRTISHNCSWKCATNVSNISNFTKKEGNLKSTFVCPITGCTHYIHQSKHLANPMFNTSQLSECLVTCCASTDTNWDCLQINISNARHLSEFRPATINTLLVVLIGLGIATTAFVIVTLLVFYCCNNPVKRSIRKVKYRQYLRDRKQYNRRALEYLVNRKYPRQSLWPTSNKRPSFFPMTNL